MARPASHHPTQRELEILNLIWETGPVNVRLVRDALCRQRPPGPAYTSVMTVMSTMVHKGYLQRTKLGNGYVYQAAIRRRTTTGRMLHDLIGRAFEGATANVALALLKDADLDQTQILELKALIRAKSKQIT